ncbi:MAG: hypothetical protein V1900_00040 [Candidatus Aenigmatarchaeota archaeon]
MNHAIETKELEITLSHNSSVEYVRANTARTPPVSILVENGGLSLLLILGISAMKKIQEPADKIMSCHTIYVTYW